MFRVDAYDLQGPMVRGPTCGLAFPWELCASGGPKKKKKKTDLHCRVFVGFVDFLGSAAFLLLLVRRRLQARLEAPLARNFDDPRGRHNHLKYKKRIRLAGTDVMIFKIFSLKNLAKILAFFAQNKAKLCKDWIITLVFEKNANIFAEIGKNRRKFVITTSTPGSLTCKQDQHLLCG
jgi:hypothetical protein